MGVIGISETWLESQVENSDLLPEGSQIPFRKDRDVLSDGLLVYVQENITYINRDDLQNSRFDSIWIEIWDDHRRILLGNY